MSPIYYIDRIVIQRVPSEYLRNIPYEILISDTFTQKFNNVDGIIFSGQLYDCGFYREPGDSARKLKVIAKTPNGIVESNALIIPSPQANQNLSFEVITKGPKQIHLIEVPFKEDIV